MVFLLAGILTFVPSVLAFVHQVEPFLHLLEPDAGTALVTGVFRMAAVHDFAVYLPFVFEDPYPDEIVSGGGDPVLECVFDQRNEQQGGTSVLLSSLTSMAVLIRTSSGRRISISAM